MNRRFTKRHVIFSALVAAAVAATMVFQPSGASAIAPAEVVAFEEAPLSPKLVEIATSVAARESVATADIVAVAPTRTGVYYAGVFVAANARGEEVVAPTPPTG